MNRLVILVTTLVALVTAATVVWMEVRQERGFRRLIADGTDHEKLLNAERAEIRRPRRAARCAARSIAGPQAGTATAFCLRVQSPSAISVSSVKNSTSKIQRCPNFLRSKRSGACWSVRPVVRVSIASS